MLSVRSWYFNIFISLVIIGVCVGYFAYHYAPVYHALVAPAIPPATPQIKELCSKRKLVKLYRERKKESAENNDLPLLTDKAVGYRSLTKEFCYDTLPVQGTIPSWLCGTFFLNGPAQFECANDRCIEWFDGLAMMHRFAINNQHVSYANRFIKSQYHKDTLATGKFSATKLNSSLFSTLSAFITSPPIYDNANVSIIKMNNELVACTETPHCFAFDPHSLHTHSPFTFTDTLQGHVCTPHPLVDRNTGVLYNVLTEFGRKSMYHVYSMAPGTAYRKLLVSLPADEPSYIHSFSLTDTYIILTLVPFRVKPFDLAFSSKPFLKNFSWHTDDATEFIVIDRAQGMVVGRYTTPAFFAFHHVNAYEQGTSIIVDAVVHPNHDIVNNMNLAYLRSHICAKPGNMKRYTIDLSKKTVTSQSIVPPDLLLESPRINEQYRGKFYAWWYAVTADDKTVLKINSNTGAITQWYSEGCFVQEPSFVPSPRPVSEDDGVLFLVVLDTKAQHSFLLLLDGISFKEIARVNVPHIIPFGFHSQFFQDSHC